MHKESTEPQKHLIGDEAFSDFLGTLRTCAIIVFSKSGFRY